MAANEKNRIFLQAALNARGHPANPTTPRSIATQAVIATAGITLEQVHHGDGIASWAVNGRAIDCGHGIRTGLEDTPSLPDGRVAKDNGELVEAAMFLTEN